MRAFATGSVVVNAPKRVLCTFSGLAAIFNWPNSQINSWVFAVVPRLCLNAERRASRPLLQTDLIRESPCKAQAQPLTVSGKNSNPASFKIRWVFMPHLARVSKTSARPSAQAARCSIGYILIPHAEQLGNLPVQPSKLNEHRMAPFPALETV
jgi:hypothetical protein